jgi:hypothetical protein
VERPAFLAFFSMTFHDFPNGTPWILMGFPWFSTSLQECLGIDLSGSTHGLRGIVRQKTDRGKFFGAN